MKASTPAPVANRWYDRVFRFCLYAMWIFSLFSTTLGGLFVLFPTPDSDVSEVHRQINMFWGLLSYPQVRLDSLMVVIISMLIVPVLLAAAAIVYQWVRRQVSGERLIFISLEFRSFHWLLIHSAAFLLIVAIVIGKAYGVVVQGDSVGLMWLQFLAVVLLGICCLVAFGVAKLLRAPLPICYFLIIIAMIALPNDLLFISSK